MCGESTLEISFDHSNLGAKHAVTSCGHGWCQHKNGA